MCGGVPKRPRSDNGDASGGLLKSPLCDGADRARAAWVSEADLDDFPVPRRNIVDIDDHSGVGSGFSGYAGAGL